MNEDTLESYNYLASKLAKKRGTPLYYFLAPRLEKYYQQAEQEMVSTGQDLDPLLQAMNRRRDLNGA